METPAKPEVVPSLSEVKEVTPEMLALPLAENMPEPTPGAAVQAAPATEIPHGQPAPKIESVLRDPKGRAFDPAIHKQNPDGSPRRDKNNFFVSHTKGQKGSNPQPGNPTVKSVMPDGSKPVSGVAPIPHIETGKDGPDEFDHAAELYFNMLIPIFCGVISPEWQPGFQYGEDGKPIIKDAKAEKESITIPLATYMRAKGTVEISPGWALLLSAGAYGGKRTLMPQTQEKIESGFTRVKKWFGFGKK